MDKISEVMVVSSACNKGSDVAIFDLHNFNNIISFKDAVCVSKGLSFVGNDFIIAALKDKPAIRCWTLSKMITENKAIVLPGLVSCLTVTQKGDFCVAGIERNLYIWDVISGSLVKIVSNHSQTVSCVRFTSDATFLISGGKDGLVFVYILAELIDAVESRDKPFYIWMSHAGAITDIFVGKLGSYARVVTASDDMTCKVYDLTNGELQFTIRTDYRISAITIDNSEYFLFLGSFEGNIYRINLFAARDGDIINCSSDSKSVYTGHSDIITSLSVSSFGQYLLSGSEDGVVRLWNINNFCCAKKIKCDGPVTNAFISLIPPGLKTNSNYSLTLCIGSFSRHEEQNSMTSIFEKVPQSKVSLMHEETVDQYFDDVIVRNPSVKIRNLQKSKASAQQLEIINQQLYAYALADISGNSSHSDSE